MANICSNCLVISGPERGIEALRKGIADQSPGALKAFTYFEIVHENVEYGLTNNLDHILNAAGGPICCSFISKWGPPVEDLAAFAKEYPAFTIEVDYDEPGNQVFGKIRYEGGACVLDKEMTPEEWYKENSDAYKDFVKDIEQSEYPDFIQRYIVDRSFREDDDWQEFGCILEKRIVARMELKDLPLLADWDWESQTASDLYYERLTKGKV